MVGYDEYQDNVSDLSSFRHKKSIMFAQSARIISGEGPFGPGLPLFRGENSNRYLRFLRASWNFWSVEGLIITATFGSRRGLINIDNKPNRNRSRVVRLGARRRARLITRSCCFRGRFSAITALAPPGPRCLATAVSKRAKSNSRIFIV